MFFHYYYNAFSQFLPWNNTINQIHNHHLRWRERNKTMFRYHLLMTNLVTTKLTLCCLLCLIVWSSGGDEELCLNAWFQMRQFFKRSLVRLVKVHSSVLQSKISSDRKYRLSALDQFGIKKVDVWTDCLSAFWKQCGRIKQKSGQVFKCSWGRVRDWLFLSICAIYATVFLCCVCISIPGLSCKIFFLLPLSPKKLIRLPLIKNYCCKCHVLCLSWRAWPFFNILQALFLQFCTALHFSWRA
jgi:hypothetical protein